MCRCLPPPVASEWCALDVIARPPHNRAHRRWRFALARYRSRDYPCWPSSPLAEADRRPFFHDVIPAAYVVSVSSIRCAAALALPHVAADVLRRCLEVSQQALPLAAALVAPSCPCPCRRRAVC